MAGANGGSRKSGPTKPKGREVAASPVSLAEATAKADALPTFDRGNHNIEYVHSDDVFAKTNVRFKIEHSPRDERLAKERLVSVSQVHPTQSWLEREGLKYYIKNPPSELPLMIRKADGKMYTLDHTRVAAQILRGKTKVRALVLQDNGVGSANRFTAPPEAV